MTVLIGILISSHVLMISEAFCCIKWLILITLRLGSFFCIRRYVKIEWTKLRTSIKNTDSAINGSHSCITMMMMILWMMIIVFVSQENNDSLDKPIIFASQKKMMPDHDHVSSDEKWEFRGWRIYFCATKKNIDSMDVVVYGFITK